MLTQPVPAVHDLPVVAPYFRQVWSCPTCGVISNLEGWARGRQTQQVCWQCQQRVVVDDEADACP